MIRNLLSAFVFAAFASLPFGMHAVVPAYDQEASLAAAKADVGNWMKYLPDEVYVANVSIPGTHDSATGYPWHSGFDNGASNSTTQVRTLPEQLEGGVRAFDFRPGLVDGVLNCNHGVSKVKLTLEEAFTILTDYLDAHPTEFYVIHLFRGNVYSLGGKPTGSGLLGAKDDAASIAQYNELFDRFFNQGKFADYIVDYTPYLKVSDIRGKMVIFRRDRIDFAHVAKAGNINGWVGDTEQWSEGRRLTVVNASDETVKGIMRATDVSSPENDAELETELSSLTNFFNFNCNLKTPNEVNSSGQRYKPDWCMMFTSGALYNENTKGYLDNATHTNPHYTALLRNAQVEGKTGPTGTVFSDWVLTDTHRYESNDYATKGVDLIPAIYENNFYYIKDFIVDEDLIPQGTYESIWEDGKYYYMRNVATGLFLSSGQWWNTHANLSKYGLKVKPEFDDINNTYELCTTLGADGAFGENDFADNQDAHLAVKAEKAGGGKYYFVTTDGTKAITAVATSGFADGTEYSVQQAPYNNGDLYQQWELIPIDEYYNSMINSASMDNGVDISFAINRWHQNDEEANATWHITSGSNSGFDLSGQNGTENSVLMLYHSNGDKGWFDFGWDASWTVEKTITDLPNGIYTLYWDALLGNISDLSMTINREEVNSKIKNDGGHKKSSIVTFANLFATGDYECAYEKFEVTDGKISIYIHNKSHSSATASAFNNFRLIYYGPKPADVEWTMEGDMYDTLILPFDATLPSGLRAYLAEEADVEDTSVEGCQLAKLVDCGDFVEANVPYIIKRVGVSSRTVQRAAASDTYTFTGVPENDTDTYTHGVLTGTHVSTTVPDEHLVMQHNPEGSWFSLDAERTVSAHHAYISNEDTPNVNIKNIVFLENIPVITGIEGVVAPEDIVDVYSITGIRLRSGVIASEALEGLAGGVYLLRGTKATVKAVRR